MEQVNWLQNTLKKASSSGEVITIKMVIAFEELKQGASWLYRLGTEILVTKTEAMRRFLARLPLTAEDTLLLDRASLMEFMRPIYELDSPAKLGFVFIQSMSLKMGTSTMSIITSLSTPNALTSLSQPLSHKRLF